jgi:hypothetical protein
VRVRTITRHLSQYGSSIYDMDVFGDANLSCAFL